MITVPADGGRSDWLPIRVRSYPRRDDGVLRLDVSLPPGSDKGPCILRRLGARSYPQWRAWLALAYLWDRSAVNGHWVRATRPRLARDSGGRLVDAKGAVILDKRGAPAAKWTDGRPVLLDADGRPVPTAGKAARERNPEASRASLADGGQHRGARLSAGTGAVAVRCPEPQGAGVGIPLDVRGRRVGRGGDAPRRAALASTSTGERPGVRMCAYRHAARPPESVARDGTRTVTGGRGRMDRLLSSAASGGRNHLAAPTKETARTKRSPRTSRLARCVTHTGNDPARLRQRPRQAHGPDGRHGTTG